MKNHPIIKNFVLNIEIKILKIFLTNLVHFTTAKSESATNFFTTSITSFSELFAKSYVLFEYDVE